MDTLTTLISLTPFVGGAVAARRTRRGVRRGIAKRYQRKQCQPLAPAVIVLTDDEAETDTLVGIDFAEPTDYSRGELQGFCRQHSLATSGNRRQLCDRLRDHLAQAS